MADFPIKTVSLKDASYPLLLKETKNPPARLFYRGVLPDSAVAMVAVVGTRKATDEGRMIAKEMAGDLSRKGVIIVSGLALGIDGAAHAGVVASGGKTVAVLANGLDFVYPFSHENLAEKILELGGCLMSEYEPGEPALPYKFLERNRIVAGLSLATIVIEAPKRSGALVTARLAAEEGREVFVVPGGARNKNYEGSHLLVRNGARLASSASHVLEDLGFAEPDQQRLDFDGDERKIVEVLSQSPDFLTIDKLSEITHLETNIINQKITFLLLAGLISETEGRFGVEHK